MPVLSWVAVEVLTGNVLADLPDLNCENGEDLTLQSTMGQYDTLAAYLPLPTAPVNWQRAVLPGAANLILLQDNLPVWGGMVISSDPSESDEVALSLVTLEGYLDRLYIGNETFTAMGQNDIVSYLITKYIVGAGIPIRVQYVNGAGSGTARTLAYLDTDDKTIYSVVQAIAALQGGPEWTIGWEWQHNPERITPVFYIGDRLGAAATPGLSPNATFDMPGCLTAFSNLTDYTSGKGATDVMATSSGQGATRPQSAHQSVTDPLRPRFEWRVSPATTTTDIPTLNSFAMGELAQLTGGTETIAMVADLNSAPKLGVDWNLGDDIGFQIGGLDANGHDTVPGFPGGFTGVSRAIGWDLQLSATPTVTPIIAGGSV